uniref:Uncharacterized protein n=1 Tax=Arundo donax TaxID=35708 RepID=A0A0A8ZCX8_ARUDO
MLDWHSLWKQTYCLEMSIIKVVCTAVPNVFLLIFIGHISSGLF